MTTAIRPRLLAALCATALALGPAACGDEDTNAENKANDTTGGSEPADASKTTATKPATDQGQIKAVAAAVQKAFETGDGRLVCDNLTSVGQRDIARYGRLTGRPGSCAQVASGIAEQNARAKLKPAPQRVVAVRVRGNRAVVLIRIAGASMVRQRYQKVDGEWKIGSLGIGAAVAGDSAP